MSKKPRTFLGERLTVEQTTVLRLLAKGYKAKQIAEEMDYSRAWVKDHISVIKTKLGAKNTTHAVTIAIREGII